jgi:ribosomal protein S18 acetylase RimI-like enzyme
MTKPDIQIRPFRADDEPVVIDLWRHCELVRPSNDPAKDIARKNAVQPELFIVAMINSLIVGTAMAGYEGHRGWINYLAVAPQYRRRGIARQMIEHIEESLRARGCPKINLQVRSSNRAATEFYRRIGFSVDEVVSMGKRLIQD